MPALYKMSWQQQKIPFCLYTVYGDWHHAWGTSWPNQILPVLVKPQGDGEVVDFRMKRKENFFGAKNRGMMMSPF